MTEEFDVAVIGTGAGGSSAAYACAQAGRTVAIIDERPFGGTCALRGCDPKKVLVGAEEIVHRRELLADSKALRGSVAIDWPALMNFKRTFTDPVPPQREAAFRDAGITTVHGSARFADPSTLEVDDRRLRAANIVLASGARPAVLGFTGEEHLTTSEEFLELQALPERIIFIGGGYISFEFAHVAARAGSKTMIFHRGERPLAQFDADLVSRLIEASAAAGIDVRTRTPVRGIQRRGASFVVQTDEGPHLADLVVHGAGRVPDLDALDLQTGGVTYTKKGVTVNEYLQSDSNPRVYAAGDAANSGGAPLTPVAGFTGDVAAHNIVHGNERRVGFDAVPSVVFTNPQLASVGALEETVDKTTTTVNAADMAGWYSYRRIGEKYAGYKVLVHKADDRVVGAHVLGPGAEELINIFTLAIRFRLPASQLRDMLFAYPTYGFDSVYMI